MKLLAFACLVMVAGGAAAQTMPLRAFVERGTKLEKKGPLALFQRGEIRALQTEMAAASRTVRGEREAAAKAGRPGAYCPPPGSTGGVRMGAQQFLKEMRAIAATLPASATTTDGMRTLLARRYPCRAA